MRKIYLLMACGLFTFVFLSCPGQGGLPPFYIYGDPTAKFQIHPSANPDIPTRVALYIDAERYTPLNALYYVLEDGTQFFDYVILGSLQLRRNAAGEVYIYTPPGLNRLLQMHTSQIRPLRAAGIKVLLAIRGGHAGVTFSTIPDEDLDRVYRGLESILQANALDGFEIWDIDGADIAKDWRSDRTGFPYPSGTHRLADGTYYTVSNPDDPYGDFTDYYWDGYITGGGGSALSDFILRLRAEILGGPGGGGIVGGDIERYIIIAREENYGAWIKFEPPQGTFTVIWEHLNFSVNPNPANFGTEGWDWDRDQPWGAIFDYLQDDRPFDASVLRHSEDNNRFGPLAIELNPANSRLNSPGLPPTTVIPPIVDLENGNCIFNFTIKFYDGQYFDIGEGDLRYSQFGIIHYRGLRPTSLAAADDVLRITREQYDALIARMIEKRDTLHLRHLDPEADIPEDLVPFDFPIIIEKIPIGGGEYRLTQAGFMSITSLFVFGQPVLLSREGGGNHIRNW